VDRALHGMGQTLELRERMAPRTMVGNRQISGYQMAGGGYRDAAWPSPPRYRKGLPNLAAARLANQAPTTQDRATPPDEGVAPDFANRRFGTSDRAVETVKDPPMARSTLNRAASWNRPLAVSPGSFCSTIELHPRRVCMCRKRGLASRWAARSKQHGRRHTAVDDAAPKQQA
jgi:hypothetical protein